jgi:lysophospholipase L1-like esterase
MSETIHDDSTPASVTAPREDGPPAPAAPAPRDDSLMSRFDRFGLRRFRAREGVIAVLIAALLLVVFEGSSVLKTGKEMNPGVGRQLVLAVGRPTNAVARALPLASVAHSATAWLNPEPSLTGPGGFSSHSLAGGGQLPPVTPSAFNPVAIGQAAAPPLHLHTMLVTGDSMSMPLDSDLARALEPKGVHVIQDPHIGTGITTPELVDWGQLSAAQVRSDHPQAVVVFIGANDGFPMPGPEGREVECCNSEWAAIYANRARQMMNSYRQAGAARVYWMTLPAPRETARRHIARVVNAAIQVAAQPWESQVRVIDTVPIFTPGFSYRDSMEIEGKPTIVRQADGIHLNEAGSSLLAKYVLADVNQDFTY